MPGSLIWPLHFVPIYSVNTVNPNCHLNWGVARFPVWRRSKVSTRRFSLDGTPIYWRHTDLLAALDQFSQRRVDGGRIRWLRIEGNSGVGKSSLLRAGLIPALENGWLDLGVTDTRLRVLGVMRPGRTPLFALAAVLARACKEPAERIEQRLRDPDFRLAHLFADCLPADRKQLPLLVVDQLEELFTLSRDSAAERQRFDQLLADAIDDDDLPLYLVTTLRSDFLGQFETAPCLNARRNNAAQYELLPVTEAGLRDIVLRSVELAGLHYSDDQLPEDIIDEARDEPGALPLISNLLRLLCDAGNGELPRSRYKTLGGLGGALAQSADDLLDQLGERNREQALRLLLALVEPGVNTANSRRSITRRQALASAGDSSDAEAILQRLSGHPGSGNSAQESDPARLVLISPGESGNPDDDQVDLIHETLLRTDTRGNPYWPTLWERIEHTNFLVTRTRLEQQARAWHKEPDTVPLAHGREFVGWAKRSVPIKAIQGGMHGLPTRKNSWNNLLLHPRYRTPLPVIDRTHRPLAGRIPPCAGKTSLPHGSSCRIARPPTHALDAPGRGQRLFDSLDAD